MSDATQLVIAYKAYDKLRFFGVFIVACFVFCISTHTLTPPQTKKKYLGKKKRALKNKKK